MKNQSKKNVTRKTLSRAQRSAIARKAAKAAWATMDSAGYKRASARGTKAVATFLAKRAA